MRAVLSWLMLVGCGLLLNAAPTLAADSGRELASTRYGIAVLGGQAYDPDHFGLVIVQGQMLLDYQRVFWHPAPKALRLKLEANLGLRTDSKPRGLIAANALALYYLQPDGQAWRPYVEAGIGLIYTDFQVEGQGLRINFNPQCGAGVEYGLANGAAMTLGVRLSHISNGNLHHDNRGINAALVTIGYLF